MRWRAEHLPNGQYVEVLGDETPGYLGEVDRRRLVKLCREIARFCRSTVSAFVGGVWEGATCPSEKGLS